MRESRAGAAPRSTRNKIADGLKEKLQGMLGNDFVPTNQERNEGEAKSNAKKELHGTFSSIASKARDRRTPPGTTVGAPLSKRDIVLDEPCFSGNRQPQGIP